MATEITTSKQFLLNWRDALHSIIMGILGAVSSPVLTYLESNNFAFNLKDMWHVAVIAAVTYLFKNFLKPSQTIITVTPPIKPKEADEELPPPGDGSGTEIPGKPPPVH